MLLFDKLIFVIHDLQIFPLMQKEKFIMYFCQICSAFHDRNEVEGTIYNTAYILVDGKKVDIGYCSKSLSEQPKSTQAQH